MTHQQYKLSREIVRLSVADTWDQAKLEWKLESIYEEEEPDTCLCGHFPIIEMCFLRNIKNGNQALVGNVCVKKFLGLPSDKIFSAVNRISKDISKSLNPEAIQHAYQKGWISEWESNFCFDTCRKRTLSAKQQSKRIEINTLVLTKIRNARHRQVKE